MGSFIANTNAHKKVARAIDSYSTVLLFGCVFGFGLGLNFKFFSLLFYVYLFPSTSIYLFTQNEKPKTK